MAKLLFYTASTDVRRVRSAIRGIREVLIRRGLSIEEWNAAVAAANEEQETLYSLDPEANAQLEDIRRIDPAVQAEVGAIMDFLERWARTDDTERGAQ